jgi:hypothetical protein
MHTSSVQQLASVPATVAPTSNLKQLSKIVRKQQQAARSMSAFGDKLMREAQAVQ